MKMSKEKIDISMFAPCGMNCKALLKYANVFFIVLSAFLRCWVDVFGDLPPICHRKFHLGGKPFTTLSNKSAAVCAISSVW